MSPDSPAVLDRGSLAAIGAMITAACHLAGWRELAAGIARRALAVARWPRRALLAWLEYVYPDEGKHSPHATMTPAPEASPVQAPRPGDPPSHSSVVRAGADDPDRPVPYWPAYLPAPAPPAAASAGQAPDAATAPAPRAIAATAAQVPSHPLAGPGQHPYPPVTHDWSDTGTLVMLPAAFGLPAAAWCPDKGTITRLSPRFDQRDTGAMEATA